jgi:hypothetical protein
MQLRQDLADARLQIETLTGADHTRCSGSLLGLIMVQYPGARHRPCCLDLPRFGYCSDVFNYSPSLRDMTRALCSGPRECRPAPGAVADAAGGGKPRRCTAEWVSAHAWAPLL